MRIQPGLKTRLRTRRLRLGAADPEKGPHVTATGGRHTGKGSCPGAASKSQQDLFRLIVPGVPQQDHGRRMPGGCVRERGIPGGAGGLLRPGGRCGHVNPDDVDGVQAQRAALLGRAGRDLGGPDLQPVIDDDCSDADPCP